MDATCVDPKLYLVVPSSSRGNLTPRKPDGDTIFPSRATQVELFQHKIIQPDEEPTYNSFEPLYEDIMRDRTPPANDQPSPEDIALSTEGAGQPGSPNNQLGPAGKRPKRNRRRTVCMACRKSKQKCDLGIPCGKCLRGGHHCVYEQRSTVEGEPQRVAAVRHGANVQ
ncbi:hypothetical protein GGTG_06802 [Gaeumannomyces tritici R3-111a-1]|uniref:Zn(2)-C6 fungal-type domain-containing protein n=1 Tax=Gaeumannomyces tritici (strain R3-111a-1) TaxID=644352 RepID=J3NZV5_GAET3|nr:hypothetical protein GGTG_06802 [Gaeumannomyces tritici R3-111a-1]EJT76888.1 hypothetical protein GGTG_06802 [Gaeumannomyces tritici R3-111a-1]